jgi:hypothetical protein
VPFKVNLMTWVYRDSQRHFDDLARRHQTAILDHRSNPSFKWHVRIGESMTRKDLILEFSCGSFPWGIIQCDFQSMVFQLRSNDEDFRLIQWNDHTIGIKWGDGPGQQKTSRSFGRFWNGGEGKDSSLWQGGRMMQFIFFFVLFCKASVVPIRCSISRLLEESPNWCTFPVTRGLPSNGSI